MRYCDRCGSECIEVAFRFNPVDGEPIYRGHCKDRCWHTGHNFIPGKKKHRFLWLKWETDNEVCSLCGLEITWGYD